MAEPLVFSPEQVAQMQELLETLPFGATIAEIMQALGVPDWTPEFAGQASLDVVAQHIADIQGQLNDWQNQRWPLIQDIVDTLVIHGDYLAEIRGKVNQYLPVTIPASPSAAAVATAVWGTNLYLHPQVNSQVNAQAALAQAGRMAHWAFLFGVVPMADNPDFAITHTSDIRFVQSFSQWDPSGLNPRERNEGETVLAYLQRMQPTRGWFLQGEYCHRFIYQTPPTVAAWLTCLVQDSPADRYVPPAGEEGEVDLEPILERLRLYMPLPGEGTAGSGTPISGEGSAFLPATSAHVLIDLAGTIAGSARFGYETPWYERLGSVAFLLDGEFDAGWPLHREGNWLRVPPGATAVWWWLKPGVTGNLIPILGAEA